MGTFSIWHWLIVLMVLGVIFGSIVAAVLTRSHLRRGQYTTRFAIYVVTSTAIAILVNVSEEAAVVLPMIPLGWVLMFLIYRWTAMRLNDVGWNRWWSLLWLIPLVGIVLGIVLCIKDGIPSQDEASVFA